MYVRIFSFRGARCKSLLAFAILISCNSCLKKLKGLVRCTDRRHKNSDITILVTIIMLL